jgi:multidrug efflux system membrane fusion protein
LTFTVRTVLGTNLASFPAAVAPGRDSTFFGTRSGGARPFPRWRPFVLLGLIGCTSSNLPPPAPAVVPVSVTKAEAKNVPVRVKTFGTVSTYATVAVKAQVAGQLTGVHFKEGDYVKKDQLLFTIDPRPYQAALNQAQANLKRDQANREYAQSEVRRLEGPRSSGAVTAEEYESARAKAQSLAGTVDADRAVIEIAKLQLDYRTIKSPLDGRTGNVMVQAGNLVKADDATLVVVNQVSPISVSFSVPEQYGPEIAKARREHLLDVETTIPNDNPPLHGTLTFIDNTVDPKTGTVRAETARGDGK